MTTVIQSHKRLSVATELNLPNDIEIINFFGIEEFNQDFTWNIELTSQHAVDTSLWLYSGVTISAHHHHAKDRYFSGVIHETTRQAHPQDNNIHHYHMVLHSWFSLLKHETDCRIFQNKSTIEIIDIIFKQHHFPPVIHQRLTKKYTRRHYCTQYNESSYQFICRLLAEEGIHFIFEHNENQHQLVLLDRLYDIPVRPIKLTENLSTPLSPLSLKTFRTKQFSTKDYDYLDPSKNLLVQHQEQNSCGAILKTPLSHYHYPGQHHIRDHGLQQLNRLANTQSRQSYEVFFSQSHNMTINTIIKSIKTPQPMRIIALTHHYAATPSQQSSQQPASTQQQIKITAVNAKTHFSPNVIPKPMMPGAQIAIVTGPEDHTVYTDNQGRIKIRFYWDRSETINTNSSCWIRVSQSLAGNGWGLKFTPQVNSEVWVDFVDSDPDRPVVIRQGHNALNPTPYPTEPGNLNGIRSPNEEPHLPANEIRFNDGANQESILVNAQRDLINKAKKNISISVNGNENHTIKKGNLSLLSHEGEYQLSAEKIHLQSGDSKIIVEKDKITFDTNSVRINCSSMTPAAMAGLPLAFAGTSGQTAGVIAGSTLSMEGAGTAAVIADGTGTMAAAATGAIEGAELGELAGPFGALLGLALGGLIGFAAKEIEDHFKPTPSPIPTPAKPEPSPYPQAHPQPETPPFIPTGPTTTPLNQPTSPAQAPINPNDKPYYTHEKYHQPPSKLPAFPNAVQEKGKTPIGRSRKVRRRWVDRKNKNILEWDYQHGAVEKYDKTGKRHLGEFDQNTGEQTKPPNPKRRINK